MILVVTGAGGGASVGSSLALQWLSADLGPVITISRREASTQFLGAVGARTKGAPHRHLSLDLNILTASEDHSFWDGLMPHLLGVDRDAPIPSSVALVNSAARHMISPVDTQLPEASMELLRTNVIAPLRLAVGMQERLGRRLKVVCNVSSNAARVPMTYNSGYNMSKAALEMGTRQLAREWRKTLNEFPTVFAVAPAKIHGTEMSDYIDLQIADQTGTTPSEARRKQAESLLGGILTADAVASSILDHVQRAVLHRPVMHGQVYSMGEVM